MSMPPKRVIAAAYVFPWSLLHLIIIYVLHFTFMLVQIIIDMTYMASCHTLIKYTEMLENTCFSDLFSISLLYEKKKNDKQQ